jgi:spermidine synthase
MHDTAAAAAPIGLLGYGGGTVARLLRAADRGVVIHGVDLDPDVLRLGRRHLRSAVAGVRVDQAEAREWLGRPGPKYGAILDDLYAPAGGRLARPAELESIPILARRRLVPGGIYAVNLRCPPGREEKQILLQIRRTFREVRVVYTLEYAHKVVVATDRPIRPGALGRALARLLEPSFRHGSLPAGAGSCNPRTLGFRTMLRLPRGSERHATST